MNSAELGKLKPLDKVIWWKSNGFGKGEFVVAWVCSGEKMPPFCLCDSKVEIRVSNLEKEAQKDIGLFVRSTNIQPYKESVWNEIQRLNQQELEISKARRDLRSGKISQEQLQASMPFFGVKT